MKRKLLTMSLSLVIASSLVLGGCGSKNESVTTSTKVEEAVEGTEKSTEKEEVAKSTETEKAEEIKVEAETETETETEKAIESTESEVSVKETSGSEVKESTSGKSKETTTSTSGSTSVSNTSGGSTSGGTSSSTETSHVHNWVPVTTTVNHPAETHQEDQGHYETVVDSEAWDEEETDVDIICFTCYNRDGSIVRIHGQEEADNHISYHYNTYGEGCRWGHKEFSTGEYIHHEAVTHQEWIPNMVTVVDKEAWDEEVITGYVCSECGATK